MITDHPKKLNLIPPTETQTSKKRLWYIIIISALVVLGIIGSFIGDNPEKSNIEQQLVKNFKDSGYDVVKVEITKITSVMPLFPRDDQKNAEFIVTLADGKTLTGSTGYTRLRPDGDWWLVGGGPDAPHLDSDTTANPNAN